MPKRCCQKSRRKRGSSLLIAQRIQRAASHRNLNLISSSQDWRSSHVTILSDEIYDRLTFDGETISFLSYPEIADRTIILNGWSKTYAMTGWRAGYAIYWPKAVVDYADRLAVNIHSCVNAPTQFAALAATTGPQACVDDMRHAFARRASLIHERLNQLDGISCPAPKGAFYAFANIRHWHGIA